MQDITCSLKTSECVLEVWGATCRIPVTFGKETFFLPVIVNENIYSLAIKIKDIFKYIYISFYYMLSTIRFARILIYKPLPLFFLKMFSLLQSNLIYIL